MSSKPETRDSNRVRDAIKKRWPASKIVKYEPGEVGTPDLIGCVEGRAVAIEMKSPTFYGSCEVAIRHTSLAQKIQLELWRKAGAITLVGCCPDHVLSTLEENLENDSATVR